MSLNIDISKVDEVLLSDGWHNVKDKSFDLDSYEFTSNEETIHGGGNNGVCATGFSFIEKETLKLISGPLTFLQAVRHSS